MKRIASVMFVLLAGQSVFAADSELVRAQKAAVGRYILIKEERAMKAALGKMNDAQTQAFKEYAAECQEARNGGPLITVNRHFGMQKMLSELDANLPFGQLAIVEEDTKHPGWWLLKDAYPIAQRYSRMESFTDKAILVCEYHISLMGKDGELVLGE